MDILEDSQMKDEVRRKFEHEPLSSLLFQIFDTVISSIQLPTCINGLTLHACHLCGIDVKLLPETGLNLD